MNEGHLERLARESGIADLVDVLAQRLAPADLTSLLLEVYRRRAAGLTPAKVLEAFESSRFAGVAVVDAAAMSAFDAGWLSLLAQLGFDGLELSPVSPLGTVAAVSTVDQNKVLTTSRNSEVLADSTNVLALEAASRRRALLRRDPRSRELVRLCASHRLVRGQLFHGPGMLPHFRLMALTTAGRAEDSFGFEVRALREHVLAHLRLLEAATGQGLAIDAVAVSLTDLTGGARQPLLQREVVAPLADEFPAVTFEFDDSRQAGRGYYRDACFFIHATTPQRQRFLLTDGGLTDWTAQLLNNRKERLAISGLGTERLISQFRAP
ncbi:hypothetical protein [Rhizocola hellebori]|uniref:hypothetical protein n=1 Tax=Rhizocola hellebori TaxID=1392758 RepID=UPI001944BE78|nr:hypothetical protein [Rhizocola hellebori]